MNPISSVIHWVYDSLFRPFLPYKISVHNGVAVGTQTKLFDMTDVFPEYEQPLVGAVRRQIDHSDRIVVVGGGLGVSTVAAARATGVGSEVITYEGSRSQYNAVQTTIEINGVQDQVNLNHAIVGSYSTFSEDGWGAPEDAEVVAPEDLPSCDVLELDCEGAEKEILSKMTIRPETVIVETHGFLDSPTEEVISLLNEAGYKITNNEELDEERDIDVLTAVHRV